MTSLLSLTEPDFTAAKACWTRCSPPQLPEYNVFPVGHLGQRQARKRHQRREGGVTWRDRLPGHSMSASPAADAPSHEAMYEKCLVYDALALAESASVPFLVLLTPGGLMHETKGIGTNLTNDQRQAHSVDLRREHLIDKVCVQEIFPPEK